MRKLIAAMNMTLDGYCDHTAGIADDDLHWHYTELLSNADTVIYGRTTYQLMEIWKTLAENPTGNEATDRFARTMDGLREKVVFSRTLTSVNWKNTRIAKRGIQEEVLELKSKEGRHILVGSPSLIVACMNLRLVDELQLCIHPVIIRKGLPLFKDIQEDITLHLLRSKALGSGAIVHYYQLGKGVTGE